jgi:sugar phosphate isomerase/epimerase
MSTRRDFLKNITLATGVLAAAPKLADGSPAGKNKMKTGIQLWTLRDIIGDDVPGTLKALSKIGYNSVEPFGYDGTFFKYSAKDFRKMCNDLGIDVTSTHTGITEENAAEYAEKAIVAGLEYLVMPSFMGRPENTLDDFKKVALELNHIGEITRKAGISLCYHNHNFEFREMEGKLPYDIMLAETDPELVSFQMDIYWVVKAGKSPQDYFEKHPGRFKTWHIKDMAMDGASCIVGNGKIKFPELMKHAKTAGLKRIFVEQEQYSEGAPLYCVEQSFKYIQKNLL